MATEQRLSLAGLGVLVTRPAHQAEPLCRLIEARGGRAIRCPVMAIEGLPAEQVASALKPLRHCQLAVFTSANAVRHALPWLPQPLPPALWLAAIGPATARALAEAGLTPTLSAPPPHNSEALLALPGLQHVAGWRVLIVRGTGGRELLAETLRSRGAEVAVAEVYRRRRPPLDAAALLAHWQRGEIQAVIATSSESLRNLFDLAGKPGQQWLPDTALVVVSERARTLARQLGWRQTVLLADSASDQAIVAALERWYPARLA
ncbi:MAG TPA: uroporphyrinogen-III synthase [Candidatus Competibacteraceae bacterium]|nr:uroporphyrinogen-III synthase [Candidatus Competibacteraceae bacterium]